MCCNQPSASRSDSPIGSGHLASSDRCRSANLQTAGETALRWLATPSAMADRAPLRGIEIRAIPARIASSGAPTATKPTSRPEPVPPPPQSARPAAPAQAEPPGRRPPGQLLRSRPIRFVNDQMRARQRTPGRLSRSGPCRASRQEITLQGLCSLFRGSREPICGPKAKSLFRGSSDTGVLRLARNMLSIGTAKSCPSAADCAVEIRYSDRDRPVPIGRGRP